MMSNMKNIHASEAPEPVGLYPHAKIVGGLIFLSGVGPRKSGQLEIPGVTLDTEGRIIDYDIEAQCHSVFENVKAILEASGSSFEKLIDVTVYLTNIENDFQKYNEVYARYFKDVQPTRTTLGITALPTPIAIELKCIASI